VTCSPCDEVVAANGLRVRPDAVIDPSAPLELILVPGGGGSIEPRRGRGGGPARRDTRLLAGLYRAGATIAPSAPGRCSWPRRACCAAGPPSRTTAPSRLRAAGATVVRARVVDDGG